MALRILIADDHGVLRAGLRALLKGEPDMAVVGEAADGHEALALAKSLNPDVVLADISMPGPGGIEVARLLKVTRPGTRVLILTMHEDAGLAAEAIRVGASGYIVKRAVETELIRAIHVVAQGGTYVHDGTHIYAGTEHGLPKDRKTTQNAQPDIPGVLGDDEIAVLQMVARGYTNRQVADSLDLDITVVESTRVRLMEKLGLHSRVDLIRFARDRGFLD